MVHNVKLSIRVATKFLFNDFSPIPTMTPLSISSSICMSIFFRIFVQYCMQKSVSILDKISTQFFVPIFQHITTIISALNFSTIFNIDFRADIYTIFHLRFLTIQCAEFHTILYANVSTNLRINLWTNICIFSYIGRLFQRFFTD